MSNSGVKPGNILLVERELSQYHNLSLLFISWSEVNKAIIISLITSLKNEKSLWNRSE